MKLGPVQWRILESMPMGGMAVEVDVPTMAAIRAEGNLSVPAQFHATPIVMVDDAGPEGFRWLHSRRKPQPYELACA